ncbi:hypothetical protein IQ276_032020 [Desmonostoc muscorum LEGE 12446]|uniref:Uncharacterized protein n=1 Tax=Desmonostoc muscorum LEGE 12446 TaxID=1828758 RepID=A0A8J7D4D1_DESMC|nr:hypothetical protein [Desmonostoc muscorum]MCF2150973.1 hypothetical protein [Desmonostoc muscorum LEGE 12446]
MKTKVEFCAYIREENEFPCIDENTLKIDFEKYREKLINNLDADGLIVISSLEEPDTRIQIQDELWAIVQNLCFIAILDLVAQKSAVVRIYNNYGYVRLDPEANQVRISGDGIPDVRIDRSDLIIALYDCGKRFIEFFRMLRGNDLEYQDVIQGLEEHAETAKQCIQDWLAIKNPNG